MMENTILTITAHEVHHDLGEKKVDFLLDNSNGTSDAG
jgi:hypothetical protein